MGFAYRTIDTKPLWKGIAWIGAGIMVFAVTVSVAALWGVMHPNPMRGMSEFGYLYAFVIGAFGLLLMLAGGSFGRPRRLWLVSVVMSSLYTISFYGLIPGLLGLLREGWAGREVVMRDTMLVSLLLISPGPVCLLFGILLKRKQNSSKVMSSSLLALLALGVTLLPGCTGPSPGKIAFAAGEHGYLYQIYVMNADGSRQVRASSGPGVDAYPAWSPDGKKIAFQSNQDGNENIYVMNSDGTNVVTLTGGDASSYAPCWSPDGKRIAFVSMSRTGSGGRDICVMNTDGSNQTRPGLPTIRPCAIGQCGRGKLLEPATGPEKGEAPVSPFEKGRTRGISIQLLTTFARMTH